MSVIKAEIKKYQGMTGDLIPIYPWNKLKKGKERGKTPIDYDWPTKVYSEKQIEKFVEKGYNLGYRIPDNQVIIDIDPRNMVGDSSEKEKTLATLAEALGYMDFEDMEETVANVSTGGGGWHFYFLLPEDYNHRLIKETIEDFPGIEFKHKGRQVVCAGSRHPSGKYYEWNCYKPLILIDEFFLDDITREEKKNSKLTDSSYGVLTPGQLQEMILSNLDPEDYATNDSWFPLLCSSHHVTAGLGADEFVQWSINDEKYSEEENSIRSRWESLYEKENVITIGTLIHELDQKGEDTTNLKAVLTFANMPTLETDDEESEEADMVNAMTAAADEIDIHDMYSVEDYEDVGVEGAAIQAANELAPYSGEEEIMKCLRLIKAATNIEREKAINIMVASKVLNKASINKLLKELDARIIDDIALLVARKTLEKTFNNGKHLTVPPSGQLWTFHKTHWKTMGDEFLAKLIQKVVGRLKEKMKIEMQELSLIQQAVKLARIEVSTLNDRIHSVDMPLPVINCKNGELWMEKDGTHKLKPHNYRSYLLNCLNVDYTPTATCPLFMKTVNEIFRDFPDTEDMIRHLGEVMGYIIQPYKNIASWWLFRGPGGDGKSTLIKVLGGILQDAQLSTSVRLLSAGSDSGYAHAFTSLVGKLSVVIEELPSSYVLREAGVKMLSENTKMEANPKGKEPYQFMYSGSLLMCSNSYPQTRDLSHGMMRRANVIPFNRQFTKEGLEDTDRVNKILTDRNEMAGVLNFMIEGLLRLRTRGRFLEPESCKAAKGEWMNHGNNVVRFINERIIKTDQPNVELAKGEDMLASYHEWCHVNGVKAKGRNTFFNDLQEMGFEIRRPRNRVVIYGGEWIEDQVTDFESITQDEFDLDEEF